MKTKKLLGMLLALTMIFSMVIIPQTVVNADYSENVLYEYDFETYTGGGVHTFAPGKNGIAVGTVSNQNQGAKLFAVTDQTTGNTYLRSGEEGGNALSNAGFTFTFDDTFTSGKYALSFDIGRGNEDSTLSNVFAVRIASSTRIVAAYMKDGNFHGYAKDNDQLAFDTTKAIPFDKNEIYRVDVVFDLDSGAISAYIDGQLLTRRESTAVLAGKQIQIRMEQPTPYLDNLKIAKITSTSFEATAEYANNTAKISFTESLLTEGTALDASDFTVTNAATGEAVAVATATKTAYDEVTLAFAEGAIKKGFTYNVAFSTDVKNIAGNAPAATSFTLPADEKTVYCEEFAGFENGYIKVDNMSKINYNGFYILNNPERIEDNAVRLKEPQAIAGGADGKAIRIIRSAITKDGGDFALKLPHKVYLEGEVTLEYRIKAGPELDVFRTYLRGKDEAGYQISPSNSIPSIYYESNSVRFVKNTTTNSGTAQIFKNGAVDADRENADYHVYKAVYHFDDETVDFYFDGEKLNTAPQPIANFENTSSGTIKRGYFNYVDMRINNDEDDYVDIDYIKVTQTSVAPYVKGITYKDYQGTAADATTAGIKEIAVSFGGNVSEASLENITLLDGTTPVAYEGKFDAATRTYTMTVPGLLAAEKNYTLNVTNAVTDPYNAPIAAEKTVAIDPVGGTKGALSVTFSKALADLAAGDKVTITATIIDTTGAAAENYALIGACRNNNTLSDVDLATLTWNGCIGTATANVTVDSLADVSVKAFVLESLSTLNPVAGSPFALN